MAYDFFILSQVTDQFLVSGIFGIYTTADLHIHI